MRRSAIGACAWRISREDPDGTPDFGNATGAFVVCGGITKFTHDFEIEGGTKIFQQDSCGAACVNVALDDIVKWVNFEITLCKDDYRIHEILGTSDAITDGGDVVGRSVTMAAGCEVVAKTPVALELWVPQYDCDELDPDFPYQRWVLSRAKLTPAGFDISADPALPVFKGRAYNNANFDDGPFGDLDVLASNNFGGALAIVDETDLPTCPDPLDYVALPPGPS